MARPKPGPFAPKLTREKFDEIIACIRGGVTRETAAATIGVSRDTLRNWLRWGAEGSTTYKGGIYAEFNAAVRAAEASVKTDLLAQIKMLALDSGRGQGDWRGLVWIAETLYPLDFDKARRRIEPDEQDETADRPPIVLGMPDGSTAPFELPQSTVTTEPNAETVGPDRNPAEPPAS